MFRLSLILAAIAACCCGVVSLPSWADEGDSLTKLDNTDISWGSSMFGIHPKMSERSMSALRRLTEKDVDMLMKMLDNKDRFLVAHVLLSEIYPVETEIHADRFYGLKISSDINGKTTYPNYEAKALSRYWTKVRKSTKPEFPSQQTP